MGLARAQSPDSSQLSIGQVLALLQNEFNDLSPSKLRFLEEQGLVTPDRTGAGYRKFSQSHIDRLRLVLTLQRDHYLPLKVIAEMLDDIDNGREPNLPASTTNQTANILRPTKVLNKEELLREAGATPQLLAEAIAAGLVPSTDVFAREIVSVMTALVALAQKGITPRHLRSLRVAAERDAQLLKQAASNRGRSATNLSAQEEALQLASCIDKVRSGVLKQQLLIS